MQSGSSWSGEFDDLLADSGFTRTEAGLEVDFFPEQGETPAGDLVREGDEGGGAVRAEFADEAVVCILDGGADNDGLYTFARFDSAVLGLTWRFR